MSRRCVICNKQSEVGMTVSHSMHHNKREFRANLQKVNIILEGKKKKAYVCTKCLKAGKVKKAA